MKKVEITTRHNILKELFTHERDISRTFRTEQFKFNDFILDECLRLVLKNQETKQQIKKLTIIAALLTIINVLLGVSLFLC